MHKYYVIGNQRLTPTTLLLTLRKDLSDRLFSFQPGQYAAISFKNKGRPTPARNFSIANSPTDQGILQFSIRLKGNFTNTLANIAIGDEVNVRGPFGGFVFDAERDHEAVMIAGGIGIAPFMSMIKFAATTNLSNKINLVYSARSQDDIPFSGQIKELTDRNPNIRATFAISDGPTDKLIGQNVNSGRITPEIMDQTVGNSYDNKTFFICGPTPFMQAMTKLLLDKGVAAEKIMTEAFGQGTGRQTGAIRSWPLNIYALGAIGVATASFVVMAADLINTLPSTASLGSTNVANPSNSTNSRQDDLDELVNGLPGLSDDAPITNGVKNNKVVAPTNTGTSTPTSMPTYTSTPTYSPTPTPAPAPAPKPAPVCTTTQSGVTTCI